MGLDYSDLKDLVPYIKSGSKIDVDKLSMLIKEIEEATVLLDEIYLMSEEIEDIDTYFFEYDKDGNDTLELREF